MRTFRIVFMGTPDFAVPCLRALLEGPDEVVAVVTQPDRPRGRGNKVQASPIKELALAHELEVLQPERIKGERGAEFRSRLAELAPDLIVVVAYGKILPVGILELPTVGCVNVHASLLPRWRGAGPIQHALAAGDDESGVCIMKMEAGMDTGPVYLRRAVPIGPEDTGATLHDTLSVLGADALMDALRLFREGVPAAEPQDDALATYAPMISREDGRLDFARSAVELERRMRAFHPWPGAFTTREGRLLKVLQATVREGGAADGVPGTVVAVGPDGLDVACGEGVLRVTEVQPEGKRAMSVAAFLAGNPVEVGERLGE